MSDFVQADYTKQFASFLDYMERDEAIYYKTFNDPQFADFTKYMSNPEKSDGLFDMWNDRLSDYKRDKISERYNNAQSKKGILWRHIISFDNNWLEKNGILKDGILDEGELKAHVRKSMTELLKKEKLLMNTTWTASIHFNTDNIHVHVSHVENKVERFRGKLKLKSIESAKRTMANSIMNRAEQYKEISRLIREEIVKPQKQKITSASLVEELQNILNHVDTKELNKNYAELSDESKLKKMIDRLTEELLQSSEKYSQLLNRLNHEEELFKEAYGSTERSYEKNKIDELKKMIGNDTLKRIRSVKYHSDQFDTKERFESQHKKFKETIQKSKRSALRKKVINVFVVRSLLKEIQQKQKELLEEHEQLEKERSMS